MRIIILPFKRPGLRFRKGNAAHLPDLARSQSRGITCTSWRMALKVDTRLHFAAAEASVSRVITLNPNHAKSRDVSQFNAIRDLELTSLLNVHPWIQVRSMPYVDHVEGY